MPRTTSGPQKENEAQRLRDLRLLLGHSQRELAKEFGVDHSAVALWESGKRSIPGPILKLIDIYQENLGMVNGPNKKTDHGFTQLTSTWIGRTLKASTTATKLASRLAASSLQQL